MNHDHKARIDKEAFYVRREYNVIDEFLDDCMDLIDLREARAAELYEPSVPLDEVIKELKKG